MIVFSENNFFPDLAGGFQSELSLISLSCSYGPDSMNFPFLAASTENFTVIQNDKFYEFSISTENSTVIWYGEVLIMSHL